MKIAIGADSYGAPLKESIKDYLINNNYEYKDFGVSDSDDQVPYYSTASDVAKCMVNKEYDRAILVCGTGMGMAIIANKYPGIYAAVCENTFSAEKSRSINNSNVLTLGSMVTSSEEAAEIVSVWLNTEFTEGWDEPMQDWLRNALDDISSLEGKQFTK